MIWIRWRKKTDTCMMLEFLCVVAHLHHHQPYLFVRIMFGTRFVLQRCFRGEGKNEKEGENWEKCDCSPKFPPPSPKSDCLIRPCSIKVMNMGAENFNYETICWLSRYWLLQKSSSVAFILKRIREKNFAVKLFNIKTMFWFCIDTLLWYMPNVVFCSISIFKDLFG